MFKSKEIALTLITPVDNLSVKDSKTTKNVIGFGKENVYTFADAKKKPEGSSDLKKDVQYDDYCIDFTLKVSKLLQHYSIWSVNSFSIMFLISNYKIHFFSEPR